MIAVSDPGVGGATCTMNEFAVFTLFYHKHGYQPIIDHLKLMRRFIVTAGIEQIGFRKGDLGKKARMTKELNQNTGRVKLCYELADIPYIEIASQSWQLRYGLGGIDDYETRKSLAWEKAKILYPYVNILKPGGDVVLMADYLRRKTFGIPFAKLESKVNRELTITKTTDY